MELHPGQEKHRLTEARPTASDPLRWAFHERKHEDWYEDLVLHSHDLLCIHDLEGRLLSLNPAPARLLGYSVEEILQIPMRELVVPEFVPQFESYLRQIERTGEAHGLVVVRARSGQQRVWEYHNTLRTEGVVTPIVRGIAHDITVQRETEKLLRELSDRLFSQVRDGERTIRELKLFRKLVDESNDAIWVVDPETLRFLDANEKACVRLGYSREELLSLSVFEIAPEVTKASMAKMVGDAREKGFVVMETVHRRKNGSTFPVELSISRVRTERDYLVTTARDMTESRRTDARLQEYERVVEGLEERILVVDRNYRYVIANRAFLHYRGLSREHVIGRTVAEVLDEKTFETIVKPRMDECFAGKVVHYELKYQYPETAERDLFASYFPIEGPSGVDRIACILQDITEQKQAEQALRDAKEFSENLIRTANVMVLSLDPDGNVALMNKAAEEITGYTFAELKGKNWSILLPRDRFPQVWEEFYRIVAGTAGEKYENPILTKQGEERYIAWRNNQVKVNGKVVATISFGNDITERRQAEQALLQSEESYRMFVSQSSEGIFREDLDAPIPVNLPEDELIHRILYDHYMAECNDAMAAMYGFTSGRQLVGKRLTEMVVPDDPRNIELTREFIRSGFRVIDRESHEVDIHGNPKIFLNSMIGTVEDGMLVHTWGIQRDITEKVKLEEARQRAEGDLRENVQRLCEVTAELALAKEKIWEEKLYLEETIDTELGFGEIIGRSTALKEVMQKVARVAPSDATVLLLGETGTGKELVARALHRLSKRQGNSFIKMNCAAIPSGLLESELFGHEKGAFTGAVARKLGRLELADKGTLFLDEIGEIPLNLQPKLLRVLQDQEFERLGGTQTLKVNFRLLAATNRDLLQSVRMREFRSDLYYRLNVFPIVIPPLRERREDIPPLVEHFVRKFSQQMKKSTLGIPSKTMEMLMMWEWPGNIRELENFVERSVILSSGSVLLAPLSELQKAVDEANGGGGNITLRDKERERILQALRNCRGKLGGPGGAAARLGLKRTTLQSKLDQFGIKPGTYRA